MKNPKTHIRIGALVGAVAAFATAIAEVVTPGTVSLTVPMILTALAAGVTAAVNVYETDSK